MKKLIAFLFLSILMSCSKDKSCTAGFTGDDCETQITPTYIKIKEVKLTKFPPTDNGAGWDLLDGPDMYFEILYNGSPFVSTKNKPFDNINGTVVKWILIGNYSIDKPFDQYAIAAFDHDDTSADDYIGGITFTPYSNSNKFPKTIVLNCPGCGTEWEIVVEYVF